MMKPSFLAIDLGAESGRAILGAEPAMPHLKDIEEFNKKHPRPQPVVIS